METLTNRIRIFALINRLMKEKALLGVHIEGGQQQYSSMILKASLDENYIVFDELKPNSGHKLLSQKLACKISGQSKGINLEFNASVKKIGSRDNIAFYVTQLPETANYKQRRASVRVPLSAATPLEVTLKKIDSDIEIIGELRDISAGGLSIRFKGNISSHIKLGDSIECTFSSPENQREQFVFDAEIKLIQHLSEPSAPAFLGCQFIDILKPQQRQIEKMIMRLQREAQKRRNDID